MAIRRNSTDHGRYGVISRDQYRKLRDGFMRDARAATGSACRCEAVRAARRMISNVIESLRD